MTTSIGRGFVIANKRQEPVETISFLWKNEGIHLTLFQPDDLRGALKKGREGQTDRANIEAVRILVDESMT